MSHSALKVYPEGDPAGLLREMGTEAYLKFADDEVDCDANLVRESIRIWPKADV